MTLNGIIRPTVDFLVSPRFVTVLTSTAVGAQVLSFAIQQLIGPPGFIAIVVTLTGLTGVSIVARWRTVAWRGILPISLSIYLTWAALSLIWSHYKWATASSLAYLACFTVMGLYVALLRDTIQIVRSFGDVMRFVLGVSLGVEILAGLLLDSPIRFLSVLGDLDQLGPIQGVLGTRNQLGIVAVIALVTFATEFRTRSVSRRLAWASLALGSAVLLLTRSPLAIGAASLVLVAALMLFLLRRVSPERIGFVQLGLLALTVITAAVIWGLRSPIVQAVDANAELSFRLDVWRQAWLLISSNPLQGWGWIGTWREDIAPFVLFQSISPRSENSASNAFIDVWLQLGLVGLAIFIGLVGLAFVRSWLLASRRKSVVFAWPALVLLAAIATSLAESSVLVEFGWATFVVCTVKAAEQLSWRRAFDKED
jgi:O-antigen ligase